MSYDTDSRMVTIISVRLKSASLRKEMYGDKKKQKTLTPRKRRQIEMKNVPFELA